MKDSKVEKWAACPALAKQWSVLKGMTVIPYELAELQASTLWHLKGDTYLHPESTVPSRDSAKVFFSIPAKQETTKVKTHRKVNSGLNKNLRQ